MYIMDIKYSIKAVEAFYNGGDRVAGEYDPAQFTAHIYSGLLLFPAYW